ncbi:MAG TPA: 6-carboxytetrahydropterin synthase [Bdellovibrionota bacterium]|nr:6-carboxytetrahydropterin synthase [Bdellovibrionota bacterium]
MSYRVTQQIHFCYGHRLLDYEGKCAHPHGHNGLAEVSFESDKLDRRGMVLDFTDIKRLLKSWIDDTMDHRMLLRKDDPLIPLLEKLGEPVYKIDVNPTAENIAREIFVHARERGLPVVEVKLWETPTQFAVYK